MPCCETCPSDSKTVFVLTFGPYDENLEKIVGMLNLIAQKKRPNALNTNQKTPALCNAPFLNKATFKKGHF